MLASLRRTFSVYTLLSIVVGVQAAILVFVHGFGNPGADVVAGSILGGLAVIAVVGHTFLAGLTISVPGDVYRALTLINGAAVALVAAGGIVLQYVGTVSPTLTPWAALALQGSALVASVLAQLFRASAATRSL